MFRIANNDDAIRWPVTIPVPQPGGSIKEAKIYVHFKVKNQNEIDDLSASGEDVVFFSAVIGGPGWEGVQDEDGTELKYTEENLSKLLQIPYVKTAMVQAYFLFIAGVSRKNSRTRPGGG